VELEPKFQAPSPPSLSFWLRPSKITWAPARQALLKGTFVFGRMFGGGRGNFGRGSRGRGRGVQGGMGDFRRGRAGKRKASFGASGGAKRQNMGGGQSWGKEPIAQQPLGGGDEWYQDSVEEQW